MKSVSNSEEANDPSPSLDSSLSSSRSSSSISISCATRPTVDIGDTPALQNGYNYRQGSSSSSFLLEDDEDEEECSSFPPGILPLQGSSLSLLDNSQRSYSNGNTYLDNSCPNLYFYEDDDLEGDDVGLIMNSPYSQNRAGGRKNKKMMKKIVNRILSLGRRGPSSDGQDTDKAEEAEAEPAAPERRLSWTFPQRRGSSTRSLGDISISSRVSLTSVKDWAQRSASKIELTRNEIANDWKEVDDGFGSILCD